VASGITEFASGVNFSKGNDMTYLTQSAFGFEMQDSCDSKFPLPGSRAESSMVIPPQTPTEEV
jgi:hypothetical protein